MNNVSYLIKGASIFLLVISMILTSIVVVAETTKPEETIIQNQEITDKNAYLTKTTDQPRFEKMYILRGWAIGNASSGKKIGFRGTIAKIEFDSLKISKFMFPPPRWEFSDYYNVTAIVFNVRQTIPEGPFVFENEWVIAIVFE